MVNPDSPTFKISEKVGLIIGKGIRYILVGLPKLNSRPFNQALRAYFELLFRLECF